MIPLSGVVHPQDVGAKCGLLALTDGHGHGDSGTRTFRLVDEDGSPVMGGGGTLVACGTPEEVAACEASYTGQYLKKVL